ncbi:MAG: HNH endonuclease [Lewinellaceae bacterium]|nr:HNH endonuclease [Saprospiraceae bacterium]MCB9337522.1 HNH endonuclease [Lewinellaceae bacterium]
MNPRYIPDAWRKLVAERAFRLCEYCLVHEEDTILTCPIDHVVPLKHGGLHHPDNLAFCCVFCNRFKGTDIGTFILPNQFSPLFNPRTDSWPAHFQLDGPLILPITNIGEATVKILKFNEVDRIIERRELMEEGLYPRPEALKFLGL